MPVTVRISPGNSTQAAIIQNVSEFNDGVMTKEDKVKLDIAAAAIASVTTTIAAINTSLDTILSRLASIDTTLANVVANANVLRSYTTAGRPAANTVPVGYEIVGGILTFNRIAAS